MNTRTLEYVSLLCCTLLLGAGCSARTEGIQPDSPTSPDRIIPSELSDVTASTAYGTVQQRRPQWLRARGPTSFLVPEGELPAVYVDNIRYGDLEVLRDIPINEILEIRYWSGPEATNRWGTGVVAGVIEVIRKEKRQ
jgi:hypothetical protein